MPCSEGQQRIITGFSAFKPSPTPGTVPTAINNVARAGFGPRALKRKLIKDDWESAEEPALVL